MMTEGVPETRLTPLQVEKTIFPRRAFGYDRSVVDVFRRDVAKEMDRLVQRVRQLEGLLADKELGLVISETYLELACERAGIADVEDFKKKIAGRARGAGSSVTGKE